jgi:hypothetical protein
MKSLPPPRVLGNTEAEKFDNAVRTMFSVSKETLRSREEDWKRAHAKKKKKRQI